MNKNLFKKMEYDLYNYKTYDIKIKNIDLDIDGLLNDVTIGGTSFEEKSSPTNAFNSSVENDVIRREDKENAAKLDALRAKKKELIREKTKIENALTFINDMDYKLIEYKYFSRNKLSWVSVAMKLGYDETYCKKRRNKVITKLMELVQI